MTTLELLKRMAKNMNSYSKLNAVYFIKFIKIVKVYFKNNSITEISINDFSSLTGLNKELSKKVLIEINANIFKK